MKRVSCWFWIVLPAGAMVLGMLAGCQATDGASGDGAQITPDQVARTPTEPNIGGIAAFYDPYKCWIWNEDKSRIRGIKVGPVYLIGPEGKGVFGDGVIRPKLFELHREPDGTKRPELVKQWSFTVGEAMPLRLKNRYALGWAYGLPLVWEDMDLAGREVRLVVTFERNDGGVVASSKRDMKVPSSVR